MEEMDTAAKLLRTWHGAPVLRAPPLPRVFLNGLLCGCSGAADDGAAGKPSKKRDSGGAAGAASAGGAGDAAALQQRVLTAGACTAMLERCLLLLRSFMDSCNKIPDEVCMFVLVYSTRRKALPLVEF